MPQKLKRLSLEEFCVLKKSNKSKEKLISKTEENQVFLNRFFDVLVGADRRRRLEFEQPVDLNFPDVHWHPNDVRNLIFSTKFREIFRENFCDRRMRRSINRPIESIEGHVSLLLST